MPTDRRIAVFLVRDRVGPLAGKRAGLGKGSIVELPILAGEPVVMKAGGQDFAKGEVVVIDENYGIRLTELLSDEG